jgi:hypothetical protein
MAPPVSQRILRLHVSPANDQGATGKKKIANVWLCSRFRGSQSEHALAEESGQIPKQNFAKLIPSMAPAGSLCLTGYLLAVAALTS